MVCITSAGQSAHVLALMDSIRPIQLLLSVSTAADVVTAMRYRFCMRMPNILLIELSYEDFSSHSTHTKSFRRRENTAKAGKGCCSAKCIYYSIYIQLFVTYATSILSVGDWTRPSTVCTIAVYLSRPN